MDLVQKFLQLVFFINIILIPGNSGNSWFPYGNKEYFVATNYNYERTWHTAREYCMSQGGDLATLSDANVTAVLMEKANNQYTFDYFWIGYNRIMKDNFRWSNGEEGIEENWAPNYPFENADFACTYVVTDTEGKWQNGRCSLEDNWSFFCQREENFTRPKTDPPTPIVQGFCPKDFFSIGNKCFRIYTPNDTNSGLTWHEARELCEKGPGYLPTLGTIQSETEAWAIMAGMKENKAELWIGLRREHNVDEFRWINNDVMPYTNWDIKSTNDDTCGYMGATGSPAEWLDGACSIKRGFLCQTFKDPTAIISTPPPTQVACLSGYTPYWYGCYRYVNITATWRDASEQCAREGSTLLSIHHPSELAAIEALRSTLEEEEEQGMLWLGLHYDEESQTYGWTDGWSLIFVNWAEDEPDRQKDGGCVGLNSRAEWSDRNCFEKNKFICKYTTAQPVTTPKQTEGECPQHENERWIPHGSYCYLIENARDYSFEQAQEQCMIMGGTLVAIHHPFLNNMLHFEVLELSLYYTSTFWIGLHRDKSGAFQWTDGSPVDYVNWEVSDERADCAVFVSGHDNNGQWLEKDCSDVSSDGYICQIEKALPATLPEPNSRCPDDEWENWGDNCYLFKPNDFAVWEMAEKDCESRGGEQGGSLASIHDVFENRHVTGRLHQISTLPIHRTYWIGLVRNETVNEWHWYDGTDLIFRNWGSQSPSTLGCAEVDSSTGEWDNRACTEPLGYVCKAHKAPIKDDGGDENDKPTNTGLSSGETAGVVIGALLVVGVFVILNAFLVVRYRRNVTSASAVSRRTSVSSGVSTYSNTSGTSKTTLVP